MAVATLSRRWRGELVKDIAVVLAGRLLTVVVAAEALAETIYQR